MSVSMSQYDQIRRAYISGESQRSISRRLGIARKTVRKYCDGSSMPWTGTPRHKPCTVITDEVRAFVEACLESDRTNGTRKQKHTAKRIYDRLVSEKGFSGSYSIVRRTVHAMKPSYAPAQLDMPLVHLPGDSIQIDWGEATIVLNGQRRKIQLFCGRLCYSCDCFVMACLKQNKESFLEALQCMFEHFGGVPKHVVFDNGKVAVKHGYGAHAEPHGYYTNFAIHYSFKPLFCNPAKGNEKGLVEGLVGFARRNFLVQVPEVKTMHELNETLSEKCLEYRENHRIAHRTQSVRKMYEADRAALHDLPGCRYETATIVQTVVWDNSTIQYDNNRYSVPVRFHRQLVCVKARANEIIIECDRSTTVRHNRLLGCEETSYELAHYLPLVAKKSRSVFHAAPVLKTVDPLVVNIGRKLPNGNKDMVRLLFLYNEYGQCNVVNAIKG